MSQVIMKKAERGKGENMILYNDKGLENAIKGTSEIIVKLASLKPTDDFNLDDISKAIYYIKQFQNECISTKHQRERRRK